MHAIAFAVIGVVIFAAGIRFGHSKFFTGFEAEVENIESEAKTAVDDVKADAKKL